MVISLPLMQQLGIMCANDMGALLSKYYCALPLFGMAFPVDHHNVCTQL